MKKSTVKIPELTPTEVPPSSNDHSHQDLTSVQDIESFFNGIRTADFQIQIQSILKEAQNAEHDQHVKIGCHDVNLTEGAKKALQLLCSVQPVTSQIPNFNVSEIIESRHYDKSEGFHVSLTVGSLSQLITPETIAWICFNVQRAIYEPELAVGVKLNAIQFQTIFDNVQLMRVDVVNDHDAFKVIIHFHYVSRYAQCLQRDAEREAKKQIQQEQELIEQAKHEAERQAIVNHVQQMMQEKDRGEKFSVIQQYSLDAQAPYKTLSMKDVALSGTYTGPPKYLKQRDQPLEIPMDCIRKLCDAMDTTYNERVELWEIQQYVDRNRQRLPFEDGIIEKMFADATAGRGYVCDSQLRGPLTHEEVASAVRGRHCWDVKSKQWGIKYRPYRDYWIALLLTVNEKIFALPLPKIVPSRIKAQFELENDYKEMTVTGNMNPITNTILSNRQYQSVTEIYKPSYQRNLSKQEAQINPEIGIGSTIRMMNTKEQPKTSMAIRSAFEKQINQRTMSEAALPRITFSAKEVYDQVKSISSKIPFWTSEHNNPINSFVPSSEQPFKPREDPSKAIADKERLMRYSSVQNKDRSLQLAVTKSLSKRQLSPLSKLRETRGMVTLKRVPYEKFIKQDKDKLVQNDQPRGGFRYEQSSDAVFRKTNTETTLMYGSKDFALITHPDPIPNPGGISVHNKLPKFWDDKEQKRKHRQEVADGLKDKETWELYHKKLPLTYVPIAQYLPDRFVQKEGSLYLQKEKWETAYTLLARSINENKIVGKPPIQKFFKVMKPEHLSREFDGSFKPFQIIQK